MKRQHARGKSDGVRLAGALAMALLLTTPGALAWAQPAGQDARGETPQPPHDTAPPQEQPSAQPSTPAAAASAGGSGGPANPFDRRPVCASMFLQADWHLSAKQKACTWINDGVFSMNGLLGAAWSAGFSQRIDMSSERGDGFLTRFGRKFGQNAAKATGAYLGAQVFGEDPRRTPPFLARRAAPPPTGFFKRTGHALGGNFIAFKCRNACTSEGDIRRVPALSRVVGSLASGFAGEMLTWDRRNSTSHALRGAASAYGSTFVNALFIEFKPELSAFAGKAFTKIFGVR